MRWVAATRRDTTRRDADVQSEIFHKEPFHRAHLLEVRASSERAFRTVCFTCRTVVRVVECTDYYAEANIYLYSFQLNRQRVRILNIKTKLQNNIHLFAMLGLKVFNKNALPVNKDLSEDLSIVSSRILYRVRNYNTLYY